MTDSKKPAHPADRPLHMTLVAALAWTVIIAASLFIHLRDEKAMAMDLAYADARSNLNKDLSFRQWGTAHGGVYVPITEEQRPIPWMAHVTGRDVTTTDGRQLTLINPASMMRQVMDRYTAEYGIRGRITGLRYLNPANAPDEWERKQLERFERTDAKEVWDVSEIEGQPFLRHMRALTMEPGCDKCHAVLGYRTGEFRGATGVNLPLAGYDAAYGRAALGHVLGYGSIWLLGLGGIGWAHRILRRKEDERAQQANEREQAAHRYRTLFDQANDGVVLMDTETLLPVDFNAVAHQQLGYSRAEFARLAVKDYEAIETEADTARRTERLRVAGADRFETRHRRKDGVVRNVFVQIQLIELDGRMLAHCNFRDITEQKRNEAELAEHRLRLEHLVEQRTRELAGKNSTLATTVEQLRSAQTQLIQQEKLSSLGALVAGVAHELNTPIGNARTVASAILENSEEFVDRVRGGEAVRRSELDRFIRQIDEGSKLLDRNLVRAADLIHSFKQVAADRTSSQRRRFDLRQTVDEIVLTLRPMLKKTPFQVDVEVAEGIGLDSYPGPLGQVIVNLVNNAVIHGFEGRDQGTVRITASLLGEANVQLDVADNGRGIPRQILPRIYDPFFTTRLGQGGSGLGLNITHNIVCGILGGRIEVASSEGQGTTFSLTLPTSAPAGAAMATVDA